VLHHVSIPVSNLERSAGFYDPVLGALGYVRAWSAGHEIGYGVDVTGDQFAIKFRGSSLSVPGAGFHIAFAARTREAVAAFHQQALQHGGRDDGAPGLRPQYAPDYYAAFVIDPDGYRIEAVHRA